LVKKEYLRNLWITDPLKNLTSEPLLINKKTDKHGNNANTNGYLLLLSRNTKLKKIKINEDIV
jgi:hypothetical protein